jgi:hypothetical protein
MIPGPAKAPDRPAVAPSAPAPPAAPAAQVPQAAAPVAPGPTAALRTLHRLAAERYAALDGYVAQMRRREQVNGRMQPEEVMLVKFRKEPWSVSFHFLGPAAKGREVVYVRGRYGDKIHTLTAAGDIPLTPAGQHIALAPDSFLVRSASRHPITEAGVGQLINWFGKLIEAQERADRQSPGTQVARLVGPTKRPEFDVPLDAVLQAIPPKHESALPQGGTRYWFFHPAWHLPVITVTYDPKGQEVEYYCYETFQAPVHLQDADFDPEMMGKKHP